MMKNIVLVLVAVLVVAGVSSAAGINVPGGVTGLWRFENSANVGHATFGSDLTFADGAPGGMLGPWTMIGTPANNGLYADGGIVQDLEWQSMTVNPNFTANGGGDYVNQYTIAMDINPVDCTNQWNSYGYHALYQTSWGPHDNDADLWLAGDGSVGVNGVYSAAGAVSTGTWHRVVLSVDLGNFFKVYVDGVQVIDLVAAGGVDEGVDGRWSLYTDQFHVFADDNWEDGPILAGTLATWGRALTADEVAGMGSTSTPLIIPEPATMSLLALGGIALLRRNRK